MNENINNQEMLELPEKAVKPDVDKLKKAWKEAVLKFNEEITSIFYNIAEQAELLDDDERDELGFSMTNTFRKYFNPFISAEKPGEKNHTEDENNG